jgi:hypothetical protein
VRQSFVADHVALRNEQRRVGHHESETVQGAEELLILAVGSGRRGAHHQS